MTPGVTRRYDRRPSVTTPTIRCAWCQRLFQPKRSDALTCSVRCRVAAWRRRHDTAPVQPDPPVSAAVNTEPVELPAGWRRMGGYLVPPPDPRFTITIYPDDRDG
jgi:hypothetical protein